MSKNALYVALAVMVIFLGAGVFAMKMPAIKYTEEKVAVYSHQGMFSHIAYSAAQEANPPAVLFPLIVDKLNILFAYTGLTDQKVTASVLLIDNTGSWQKEIPVQVTGGNPVSFPLDLTQLLTLGNTIDKELGIRGNGFTVKIVAQVGTDFPLTLEGNLDATMLSWDESGFYKAERGFPGSETFRAAAFGYQAKLKDNSLYGAVTIERTPDIPVLAVINSDAVLTTDLVQSADIGFNYQFTSSDQITSISQEVSLLMIMSETGGWIAKYELVPPTKIDNPKFIIPLDMKKLAEIADRYDQSSGSRASVDRNITITAQVHTIARMASGVIDETFTQQLNGTIGGRLVTWQDTDKTGASQLKLVKSGNVKRTVSTPDKTVNDIRLISFILFGLSAVLFIFLLRLYLLRKTRPTLQNVLDAANKKYPDLISEVSEISPLKEHETLIFVPSLEELVKIANNSLKPVLVQVTPDLLTYRVIDGTATYQFIYSIEQVASPEKTKEPSSGPER